MGMLHVGDTLTIAELQRFEFGRSEHTGEFMLAQGAQAGANRGIG